MHDYNKTQCCLSSDLWSLIETSNSSFFTCNMQSFHMNKSLGNVSKFTFFNGLHLWHRWLVCSFVLFWYILTYFSPVTFCIPVHCHVYAKNKWWNFKARFEAYSIDSVHDESVFQLPITDAFWLIVTFRRHV